MCFVQYIIKQLLDLVFVISRIIKVSLKVMNPYLNLDYSGYQKKAHPIIVYNIAMDFNIVLELPNIYLEL